MLSLLLCFNVALGLPRNSQPLEFRKYFSTDLSCAMTYGGVRLVPSILARQRTWEPFTIYFACYESVARLANVLLDPNNLIPAFGDGSETLLIDGHKLYCVEEFHVVFIMKFRVNGLEVAKGYCMFNAPILEDEFIGSNRPLNRLAHFKAVPQPASPAVYDDINVYNGWVRQHMKDIEKLAFDDRKDALELIESRNRHRASGSRAPAADMAVDGPASQNDAPSGSILSASLQRPGPGSSR